MKQKLMVIVTVFIWLSLLGAIIYYRMGEKPKQSEMEQTAGLLDQGQKPVEEVAFDKPLPAKQAVMESDAAAMDAYGLFYDYANLSLEDTVKAFLDEFGIPHESVAFSYKNTATGQVFSMNADQPMTAGSTYKLPLNMLIMDGVREGKFSMEEEYNISETDYENENEYRAYLGQFGEAMTIPEMQEYSLVYSENTPAHGMVKMLGGFEKAYKKMARYGQSDSPIKTMSIKDGNKTTSGFYLQVLDYLWHHQDDYRSVLDFIGVSFPNQYYKVFWPNLTIYQKPGYIADALNVGAIVYEETPYLIAIYTVGLGGATPDEPEINGFGYYQLTQLTYVINEWHRVNQNP